MTAFTDADVQLVALALAVGCCDGRSSICRGHWNDAHAALTALADAGRLTEEPKPLHLLPPKERQALREATADERLKVDDPDREKLAGALHAIDCGWNCDGHGVMQPAQDRRYRRMADVALRTLAGRLTPDGARHAWGVRLAPVDPDTTVIRQCSSREDAGAKVGDGGTVVTRVLGPWVEADGTPEAGNG